MPTISMFFGIIVRMYNMDTQQHNLPHIHCEYQGNDAVFDIETAEVLSGDFPRKQTRLVQAWIEIHNEELMADWHLAVNGERIFKIKPLD
ncbi:MAG: DUF4160 domain-containing protein [Fibrobacterota bacterium]